MIKKITAHRYHDFSTGHRVYQHESKCAHLHGHNYRIHFYCEAPQLDSVGRVIDFSDIKTYLCNWLEDEWDHRLLLAYDDPLLEDFKQLHEKGGVNLNVMPEGYGPGIEDSCKYIYDKITPMIALKTFGRAWIENIRIYEHENNWADYGL